MRPVMSFSVALRLPLTALVETMPSARALPPNIRIIVPSMPSNLTCPLSRVLTSAAAGATERVRSEETKTSAENSGSQRVDDLIGTSVWGAHQFYTCAQPARRHGSAQLRLRRHHARFARRR